jgi:hypothetical protein
MPEMRPVDRSIPYDHIDQACVTGFGAIEAVLLAKVRYEGPPSLSPAVPI